MIPVEVALIGALMTSRDAYFKMNIDIEPKMFADNDLAWVFKAIQQLANDGIDVDLVMVEEYMRRLDPKRFEERKGMSFVLADMMNIRHDGNVSHYAAEVYRLYRFRTLAALCTDAALKAAAALGDPDELVAEIDRQLGDFMTVSLGGKGTVPLAEVAAETFEMHKQRASGEQKMELLCGLEEIDYVTGGFHPGELSVLAGRPSEGKTAVALQMALNIARSGHHVCFFSLEMSQQQMANRVFMNMTSVNPAKLRSMRPDQYDIEQLGHAVDKLEGLPFYLDYTAGSSLEAIRRKAFQRSRMGQCDMVVVDYLHLISGQRNRGETQEQYIGSCITSLKRLALELNCPVLVLSQMNRQCENRADRNFIPQMNDLRDSGTIEQVADCIMFVYRLARHGIEEDPMTHEQTKGMGKILITKNRNGNVGYGRFRHNDSFTRLTNYVISQNTQMQFDYE